MAQRMKAITSHLADFGAECPLPLSLLPPSPADRRATRTPTRLGQPARRRRQRWRWRRPAIRRAASGWTRAPRRSLGARSGRTRRDLSRHAFRFRLKLITTRSNKRKTVQYLVTNYAVIIQHHI